MKTKFKFTKEKWYITENGLSVSNVEKKESISHGTICRLHTGIDDYDNYTYNALLISKAPEMINLMADILECLDYNEMDEDNQSYYKQKLINLIKEATTL